jgi:hypothetical protein
MATEGPSADEEQRLPLLVWPERVAPTPKSPTISPTDSAKEPPSDISTRIHIEIGGDELNDFEPELWVGMKGLQPCQQRNDFVATFQIQFEVCDIGQIETSLIMVVLADHAHSSKICV